MSNHNLFTFTLYKTDLIMKMISGCSSVAFFWSGRYIWILLHNKDD